MGVAWGLAPQQSQRQPRSEDRGFSEGENPGRHPAKIRLADQLGERSESGTGSVGGDRDGVDGAARERTSRERESKTCHSAAESGKQRRVQPRASWFERSIRHASGRRRKAEPRTRANDHAFRAAPDHDVQANQCGQRPARQPLDGKADQAAAKCRRYRQCEDALRARERFREPHARADTRAAERTAATADHRKDRSDRQRSTAIGSGRKDQPTETTGRDTGDGSATRGAGPSVRSRIRRRWLWVSKSSARLRLDDRGRSPSGN